MVDESRLVGDRYALHAVIGRGGMADVYRATDVLLDRQVAVKVLRSTSPEPVERERFTSESRILAGLNHGGLVTVLDAGVDQDRPFFVMELIEGDTLTELCAGGPLPLRRVAAIGAALADALAYAHAAGVVHRDVKPGNVLLDHDGRARLTDFGIARILSDTVRHTGTGMTIGTAAYLSPEQISGGAVGTATDVYSLGLLLLEALTGRPAFAGPALETAAARLHRQPEIPSSIPHEWRELLTSMTAIDADLRPSAAEVRGCVLRLTDVGRVDEATTAVIGATRTLPAPDVARETSHGGDREATQQLRTSRGLSLPLLHRARSTARFLVLGAVAAIVVVMVAVVAGSGDGGRTDQDEIPNSVPSNLQQPLADLHAAINGRDE